MVLHNDEAACLLSKLFNIGGAMDNEHAGQYFGTKHNNTGIVFRE